MQDVTPTAKSLILDLLSSLRKGTMPVSALVRAGDLFEIAENNIRVALARLLAGGQVERDERGCYRLGPRSAAVNRRVTEWRRLDQRLRDWDGRWLGVHGAPRAGRGAQSRRRERALLMLGFQELAPGLAIRPANLISRIDEIRDELLALGLENGALVIGIDELPPDTNAVARGLWDVAGLCDGYRRALEALRASELHLQGLGEEEAMLESYLLGGAVLRELALDPLLPDPIVPSAERQALVAAMRRYERLGFVCWAGFMERYGVLTARSPAQTSGAAGAELH